jgi:hypothetical protein
LVQSIQQIGGMGSITHATSGTSGPGTKTFRSAYITEHKTIPE